MVNHTVGKKRTGTRGKADKRSSRRLHSGKRPRTVSGAKKKSKRTTSTRLLSALGDSHRRHGTTAAVEWQRLDSVSSSYESVPESMAAALNSLSVDGTATVIRVNAAFGRQKQVTVLKTGIDEAMERGALIGASHLRRVVIVDTQRHSQTRDTTKKRALTRTRVQWLIPNASSKSKAAGIGSAVHRLSAAQQLAVERCEVGQSIRLPPKFTVARKSATVATLKEANGWLFKLKRSLSSATAVGSRKRTEHTSSRWREGRRAPSESTTSTCALPLATTKAPTRASAKRAFGKTMPSASGWLTSTSSTPQSSSSPSSGWKVPSTTSSSGWAPVSSSTHSSAIGWKYTPPSSGWTPHSSSSSSSTGFTVAPTTTMPTRGWALPYSSTATTPSGFLSSTSGPSLSWTPTAALSSATTSSGFSPSLPSSTWSFAASPTAGWGNSGCALPASTGCALPDWSSFLGPSPAQSQHYPAIGSSSMSALSMPLPATTTSLPTQHSSTQWGLPSKSSTSTSSSSLHSSSQWTASSSSTSSGYSAADWSAVSVKSFHKWDEAFVRGKFLSQMAGMKTTSVFAEKLESPRITLLLKQLQLAIESKAVSCTKLVFHGTSEKVVSSIAQNGFNRDFNSRSVYGKGVYSSPKASVAHSYTGDGTKHARHMFACILGIDKYTIGRGDILKPPLADDGSTQIDTLVNSMDAPTVFVSMKDNNIVPVFLLSYALASD